MTSGDRAQGETTIAGSLCPRFRTVMVHIFFILFNLVLVLKLTIMKALNVVYMIEMHNLKMIYHQESVSHNSQSLTKVTLYIYIT